MPLRESLIRAHQKSMNAHPLKAAQKIRDMSEEVKNSYIKDNEWDNANIWICDMWTTKE